MWPRTPASSHASRSAAWLCDIKGSGAPLGNVHLPPPLVFTSRNSIDSTCRRKQTAATCSGRANRERRGETTCHSSIEDPDLLMIVGEYCRNVKLHQKRCSGGGYGRSKKGRS